MTTRDLDRRPGRSARADRPDRLRVLAWYVAALVLSFIVPLVGTTWWGLQPDLYYLGYATVVLAFSAAFVARYSPDLEDLWTRRPWLSIAIGALVGAGLAAVVLRQDGVDSAEGWRLGFEIVWRGVVYGGIDALLLFVLPAAVAHLLMGGDRSGARRHAAFAVLALALSMVITATYHLGYSEFRDDAIRYPEIGAVAANVPTVLTGNPVGAVVAHTTMHVTAVVHQRDGGEQHMLPPRVDDAYPAHGDPDVAAGLAAGWLVVVGGALWLLRRRRSGRP